MEPMEHYLDGCDDGWRIACWNMNDGKSDEFLIRIFDEDGKYVTSFRGSAKQECEDL